MLDAIRHLFSLFISWLLGRTLEVTSFGNTIHLDPRRLRFVPKIAGGAGDDDKDDDADDKDKDDDEDADDDDSDDDSDDDDDDADGKGKDKAGGDKINWKSKSRQHERRSKRYKAELDAAIRERDTLKADAAKKSDKKPDKPDEDALKAAREEAAEEARQAARAEAREERRSDRLEIAVTRQSVKGVEIEIEVDGATKTKTVKFADPEDVQMYIERQIDRGEIDADDIFDDKDKIDADALTEILVEIAESKPKWLTDGDGTGGGGGKSAGDGDGGKGKRKKGAGEELGVGGHLDKVRRNKT